jgi:hypothetical protein
MKYLITFPPGALGHFLSRVLSNKYDFRASSKGSYHDLEKTYTSLTTDQEHWISDALPQDVECIVCAHNFDNRDLRQWYPEHFWIDIQINGLEEIYLNNYYRKAIQSNPSMTQEYIDCAKQKFPGHNHPLREEFFFLHQHLVKRDLPWVHSRKDVYIFGFTSFYNCDDFVQTITEIPGIPKLDYAVIWQDFVAKQRPIIERYKQYQNICQAINNNKTVDIPGYFDDVDYGIMCAMLYSQTGQDLLNLQNKHWLR